MVDITKDELWESNHDETYKIEGKFSKVKTFIEKYRIIISLLVVLNILITVNMFLIYNFFKMFIKI